MTTCSLNVEFDMIDSSRNAFLKSKKNGLTSGLQNKILKSSYFSRLYAQTVISGRWEIAEITISGRSFDAYHYANSCLKGTRVPCIESAIAKSPEYSYMYLKNCQIVGDVSELEESISHDAQASYLYATEVLHSRFILGEMTILKVPRLAQLYAQKIIVGRWFDAEQVIKTDVFLAVDYAKDVIHGEWKDIEDDILNYPCLLLTYIIDVKKQRWIEAEDSLLTDKRCKELYLAFAKDNFSSQDYAELLLKI